MAGLTRWVHSLDPSDPATIAYLAPRIACPMPCSRTSQAAQFEGALPPLCVAVEDSASGVGSAYAAQMGLIVGYVGASHISAVSVVRCVVLQYSSRNVVFYFQ